jgi:UPF0176 protein
MPSQIKILLYYKYVTIPNPAEIRDPQKALCQRLGIKGRILISAEGINGTVAGEEAAINEYMAETAKEP